MRNKLYLIIASCTLVLAMLACNTPDGPSSDQPDLVATITAQALIIQGTSGTAASTDTPEAGNTTVPSDTPLAENAQGPTNTPKPEDTAGPAAPSKPKDFKADGSGQAISFTWSDNAVNENGFRIYQEGVVAPVISIGAHPSTGGMSYNWTGLTCAFSGNFFIRAFNDQGESDSSKSDDAVTIPCQPASLIGTGQGYTISFNWGVSAGHNETGFRIYQQGVPSPVGTRGPNKGSGGTNFDLTGLHCDTVGTYSVTAFNSAGESTPSNLIQAESVPCGPFGFTITGTTKDTVNYTWTDNATSETGYHVYIDDVLYATLPAQIGTGQISNDAFQICGQNHVYSVKAFNYAGESTTSEHVGASTLAC